MGSRQTDRSAGGMPVDGKQGAPASDRKASPAGEQAVSAHPTLVTARPRLPVARRRLALWIPLFVLVAAVGWLTYARLSHESVTRDYVTAAVSRGDITSMVTATGSLSPVVEVQVGSLVSGRIKELPADYNSEVKAGQVIALLDPRLFETAVAQAKGRLTSAQAGLARAKAVAVNARREFERLSGLGDDGIVALADVDKARADWLAAQAQETAARADISQARAALEQSTVNLAYTTIRSPIDGIVVSRNVDVGQVVAASLQAPTLFVIAEDLRKLEVHTNVAESDVGQLAPGTRAEFFVDAYPGESFAGVVKQVRYEALNVSNVVTYDAILSVENSELKLRPGMTANVNFIIDQHRNVLVVPNRALRFQPSDPKMQSEMTSLGAARSRTIWKRDAAGLSEISIIVGLSDGSNTEVVAGPLEDGDIVVIGEGKGIATSKTGPPRRGPPRIF